MKKYIYMLMGVGAMMMASCNDDIDVNVASPGQEVEVTFSTALPTQMLSRATSDGTTANRLNYTVFKADGTKVLTKEVTSAFQTTRTEEVSIPLITGETYTIAFWADYNGGPYTYDGETAAVTVTPSKLKANDEQADAFFWTEENLKITGPISKTVYLTRPFAQINFGTTKEDYEAAKLSQLDISTTQVTVTGTTYSNLDLRTGAVSNPVNVEYTMNTQPSNPKTLTVEGTDYVYVAYAYVLTPPVDKAETLTKVTLTPKATDAAVREYTTIPVKRNYRTNIIGNLFTSTVDFKVIIDQEFDGEYNVDNTPWDGTSKAAPYALTIDGQDVLVVASAAQLAGLAAMVNGTDTSLGTYDGSTPIILDIDVDLNGKEWTPIGTASRSGSGTATNSKAFTGTFVGNGHSITGLTITSGTGDDAVGLFGALDDATVSDLNIVANISTSAVNVGAVAGLAVNGSEISKVTVSGSISGAKGVGGVVGRMTISGTIEDCKNNATITSTSGNTGGIVGAAYYSSTDKVIEITNCTNNGEVTSTSSGYTGGIAGLSCAFIEGCENYGNVTSNGASIGGIVGEQRCYGSITDCTNHATAVTNNGSGYGTGGIVGWIRYNTDTNAYSLQKEITVSGCVNYASVYGGSDAGGIVGTAYNLATVTENKNYAKELFSSNFVAGIVGNAQFAETLPSIITATNMVTVAYNVSTTPGIAMTGQCKAGYVYDNSQGQYCTDKYNTGYVEGTTVATLDALTIALSSGGYIELTADITGSTTAAAAVASATTVLYGNDNTITTTYGRGIQLSEKAASGSSLTIYDLTLDMSDATPSGGTIRGIQANMGGTLSNPEISLSNVTVLTAGSPYSDYDNYGINIPDGLGTIKLNLEDCRIDAYQCINLYSFGFLNISNSTLNSLSNKVSGWSGGCINIFGTSAGGNVVEDHMTIYLDNVDFNRITGSGLVENTIINVGWGYSKTVKIYATNCTVNGKAFTADAITIDKGTTSKAGACTVILNGEKIYQGQQ